MDLSRKKKKAWGIYSGQRHGRTYGKKEFTRIEIFGEKGNDRKSLFSPLATFQLLQPFLRILPGTDLSITPQRVPFGDFLKFSNFLRPLKFPNVSGNGLVPFLNFSEYFGTNFTPPKQFSPFLFLVKNALKIKSKKHVGSGFSIYRAGEKLKGVIFFPPVGGKMVISSPTFATELYQRVFKIWC